MTALEFLSGWPWLPQSIERSGRPSRGEVRRWCRAHSVLINGTRPNELDAIPHLDTLGLWQLVFFPDNPKRQCTMVQAFISLSSDPAPEDSGRDDDGESCVGKM